ncbi:MAG: hypothetical protein PVF17_06345 [Ignavibacteria bacterium]
MVKIIGLISLLLIAVNCNTTEPPTNNTKPGRRDYEWTVDTLFLPFNSFTDITGTSPTDVWACGPGGDLDKTFYHFDGQNWNSDLVSRPFSPKSISSISHNNVWSSGLTGRIWKFNGQNWEQNYQHNVNGNYDIAFESIIVISPSKILVAGQYFVNPDYWGIILRYTGTEWVQLNISQIRTAFADVKASDNGKIYLWGVTNEQFSESRYKFYELEGENLTEIYNGSQSTDAEYGSLLQISNKTYFIIGYDFFSYNGNNFSKVGRLSDDSKFLNVGWGRSVKDVFIGMRDGVAHYNGENTAYIFQSSENIFVRNGIIFDKEVFFIGRTNGNNLLIHGKLNEQ